MDFPIRREKFPFGRKKLKKFLFCQHFALNL